jgi:adenine-specific DNA-methyltransferase
MPTLDWLNRTAAFTTADNVPYRLLEDVSAHGSEPGSPGNLLIQGDNLEAIKALLPFYRGQVKCIFIDPPYNTKSAFEHYDDNLEHAQWLSMMLPRLQLLRELLREDGSIWVTIDDNEGHYLKVLMDEVFGRGNFVANVVWEKSDSPKMDSQLFSTRHDHLHVFAKNSVTFSLKRLISDTAAHYDKVDDGGRLYYLKPLRAMGGQGDSREARPNLYFPLIAPDETNVYPKRTDGKDGAWRWSRNKVEDEKSRIEWRNGKNGWSAYFRIYADTSNGRPAETIWTHSDVGSNRTSKAEVKALLAANGDFTTPKPEALLARILNLATNPNDLVLDSFLGSGTTAAVAHKMGRRWIGIEMGEHAATHCLPRLQKVIAGEQGGISKAVGWGVAADGGEWQGGGGFRFMKLGAPVFDAHGRIHPDVRFATLAAFVWQQETGTPFAAPGAKPGTPYLGTYYTFDSCLRTVDGGSEPISSIRMPQFACYLLFNGILGDKRPASGNVLTQAVLDALLTLHATTPEPQAPLLVYGEACRLGEARLKQANVTFRHIPYDVRAR